MRSVCVYCGSSEGDRPAYAAAARALGRALATLVADMDTQASRFEEKRDALKARLAARG